MAALATLERQEAERFAREFEDLFYRGDSATMASYYTDDAKLMAQDEETIEGRPAIERFWRFTCEGARTVQMKRAIDVQEVGASGGIGYMRGVVTVRIRTAEERENTIVSRYLTLWRRETDGGWRLVVDISNRSAPFAEDLVRQEIPRRAAVRIREYIDTDGPSAGGADLAAIRNSRMEYTMTKLKLDTGSVGGQEEASEATAAVSFSGATKSYGAVRAVDGLDLSIRRGETVALLGPNGAGKSTSIGMLLGLVEPDAGTVRIFGRTPEDAVRDGRVGAMLQEDGLPTNVKVGELVSFVRRLYPRPLPEEEVMATAVLTHLAARKVDGLSGGQRQRVRFALALAGNPDLLVLDEPTAAMDVESRRAFWKGMRAQAEAGRTILFSTHNMEEADENAERIVVIAAGRVVADGSGAEIKARAVGRTVTFDLSGGPTTGLDRLPGVLSVEVRGDRAVLRTGDSDATVAALLADRGPVRGLEVGGAGLEDAFLALTSTGTDG